LNSSLEEEKLMDTFETIINRVAMVLVLLLTMMVLAVPGIAQIGSVKTGTTQAASQHDFLSDNARFVRLAGHHGTYGDAAITWESELVVDGAKLPQSRQIGLVEPLSPKTELVGSAPGGARAVRAASGEVVGVEFPASVHTSRVVRLTLRQPFEAPGELNAPLVAGRIIQRVSLDGVVYEPSEASATRLHPGYRAQKDLSDEQIDWCKDSLDELAELSGVPIFVRPDVAFFAAGALDGELVDAEAHRGGQLWVVATCFAALLLMLIAGFYVLAGRARHEEADAFLSLYDVDHVVS
jgi:hypothetical protein